MLCYKHAHQMKFEKKKNKLRFKCIFCRELKLEQFYLQAVFRNSEHSFDNRSVPRAF